MLSEMITQAPEDVTVEVNRRLHAIAAELDRVLDEVSNLGPSQIPSVHGAVAEVERAAASLTPRLEWIRWRARDTLRAARRPARAS